jgi:DNA-directed RNA polymerase specialized sigma subunit
MSEDAELLRQYAQSGSETAFAELVGRHLPLVYATALRLGARRCPMIHAESIC